MQPLVSICIPTYGRVEILKNTLNSIFSQNVDPEIFEVCISDNSPTDETQELLDSFFSSNYNIKYSKSTCEGYYNSIESLKLGCGKYLKLHNNYSKFKENSFQEFINSVLRYETEKPVLFFSFGAINNSSEQKKFSTFDSFLNEISYFSTWSTSFGIWKEDFDALMSKNFDFDKMFPHTSLLFALWDKKDFVVDNALYFDNQDVGKKGGYNLPETFGTRYLGMCHNLLADGKIGEQTYQKIKNGILQFIADWYVNVTYFGNKYKFSFENWEKTIIDLYGEAGILFIKNTAKRKKLKCLIRKILNRY